MSKSKSPSKPKSTTKKTTPTPLINSKLTWLPKKTFELEITVPQKLVKATYSQVLDHAVKDTVVKGFRKGKAPKNLVEKQIGKKKLYDQTIKDLVSTAYYQSINQHKLRPIIEPKILPVSIEESKDWVLKATSCEIPEVKLGKYKEAIKALKAKSAIWTPDKGKPDAKDEKPTKPSSQQVLQELLKNVEIELANILVEHETNRMLAQFIDQIQTTGMTVQQYMDAQKLTQETLKAQYQTQAENTLKVEFALAKIAEENKITVDPKEIDEVIAKTQDPNAKKSLENPQQRTYLGIILRKQKTLDFLTSL
jgi:FKBP-type peptidyl-prolyl cis-trans isomerase (trigger factor)